MIVIYIRVTKEIYERDRLLPEKLGGGVSDKLNLAVRGEEEREIPRIHSLRRRRLGEGPVWWGNKGLTWGRLSMR